MVSSLKPVIGDEPSPITRLLLEGEFRSPSELSRALEGQLDPLARGDARKMLVQRVQGELPIQSRATARPARRPTPTGTGLTDPLQMGGPSPVVQTSFDDALLDDAELMKGVKRGGFGKFVFVLLVIGAVAIAGIAVFRPDLMNELLVSVGMREAPEPEPVIEPEPTPDPTGTFILRVATEGAEVFRFVGRAPVSIEALAVRETHEILAVVEDRPILRHRITPTDGWNNAEPATLELALQVPEEEREFDESEVAQSDDARVGTLRVITDPAGAKVFHRAGSGPEVRFDELPMDQPFELLVIAEGHQPQREIVTASQWEGTTIEREITLREAARRRRRNRGEMSSRMRASGSDDFTLGADEEAQ